MPTVAVVDGVKIQFFASEHPPPHFHAKFAEHRASIVIADLSVLNGYLPPAKLFRVIEWAETRQLALMQAWASLEAKQKPDRIA